MPSSATEDIDRGQKLRIYEREGVAYVWFIDPLRQTLEVLALDSGRLGHLDEYQGNAITRARPFDAIELELRALWI